jgi:hypothetical protein
MHTADIQGTSLRREVSPWLHRFAKVGYAVKGVVYTIIGTLAMRFALGGGGKLAGQQDAVRHVQKQPFGELPVTIIGIGLLGYAAWRFIEAAMNLQGNRNDAMGVTRRLAGVISSLVNGAVAIVALQLAAGDDAQGSGKNWVASLMNADSGRVLLGVVSLGIVAAGVLQLAKGYRKEFLRELRLSAMRPQSLPWMTRLGQIGHIARGVVFVIAGGALGLAVLEHDPSQAKTFGEALGEIAAQPFGMILLGVVALGLLAFGAFLVYTARYRRLGTL